MYATLSDKNATIRKLVQNISSFISMIKYINECEDLKNKKFYFFRS